VEKELLHLLERERQADRAEVILTAQAHKVLQEIHPLRTPLKVFLEVVQEITQTMQVLEEAQQRKVKIHLMAQHLQQVHNQRLKVETEVL
jgi:hypothetical protein